MARRYSFICVFFSLLFTLAWWSHRIEAVPSPSEDLNRSTAGASVPLVSPSGVHVSQRVELIEVLDRIVAYEHYYRSVYGHFTKLLSRVGVTIPRGVLDVYEIRVAEASPDRLLLTAMSEIDGKMGDMVSIDQTYQLQANFSLPVPRAEYLRAKALKHLRFLQESPEGQLIEESGVFQGYFRYEVKRDIYDRRTAFAIGIRQPVVGLQLDAGVHQSNSYESLVSRVPGVVDMDNAEADASVTGQRPVGNVMSTMEEVHLAQKIFHGEMGRYAKNWAELSKIAAFRFEEKEHYDIDVVRGDEFEKLVEIDLLETGGREAPGLIIEPIGSKQSQRIPVREPARYSESSQN